MPEIKLGDYLFQRLRSLGVHSVFGVPGDYELALLDLIPDNQMVWKGNANELVASYAADGYARVKGAGAFVTTFGPGELSAYCGMGGQYCEFVPVAHIVGYPSTISQNEHAVMHHTLGDGRFNVYEQMADKVSCALTVLRDPATATAEIDRVLSTMMIESRPVYIGIPTDIAYQPVSDEGLKTPLNIALPLNDKAIEEKAINAIRAALEKAQKPAIILDGGAIRHDCLDETDELIKMLNIPVYVTAMGKGGVDETLPCFAGSYAGSASFPEVRKTVESSDLVLWLGSYKSDFNTAEFTMNIDPKIVVDFQRFFMTVRGEKVDLRMKQTLQALIASLKTTPIPRPVTELALKPYPVDYTKDGPLTQDYLWQALGNFFQPGDFIIGETGTSAFGLSASPLPRGSFTYNQTIFGSIGYATGAAVGASQAIAEGPSPHARSAFAQRRFQRCILVTGEGSLHLTVQALPDLLRWGLRPVVLVLNNSGYTVERLIHGPAAQYNEVAVWDYGRLAQTFGPACASRYHGPIATNAELTALIAGGALREECFQLVELVLGELDCPMSVKFTLGQVDTYNERTSSA